MNGIVATVAGSLALVAGLLAVSVSTVVHALLWLLAALLALAAAFFALGAGFAGALQILIYAGAIVAIFVFVVMTVPSTAPVRARERSGLRRAWPAAATLAALIVLAFLPGLRGMAPAAVAAAIPVRAVGALLFGPWGLVVELASYLLLAAMLGARHLARRASPSPAEAPSSSGETPP